MNATEAHRIAATQQRQFDVEAMKVFLQRLRKQIESAAARGAFMTQQSLEGINTRTEEVICSELGNDGYRVHVSDESGCDRYLVVDWSGT